MLIVTGGSRTNRVFAQTRIERFAVQVGKFVEQRFGPGGGGEDAAHGGQGEGAEADGAVHRLAHIIAAVVGDEREQLLRLQFSLGLLGEQAVEELHGDGAEFAEALAQEQGALSGIVGAMMGHDLLARARRCAGYQRMPGDFVEAERVDDDFVFGDAHGQRLADVRPRHRVKIQAMRDVALDIDVAIEELSRVEVAGRQRQEVRLFDDVTLKRRLLEVAHDAQIGDVREPPRGHFVEML